MREVTRPPRHGQQKIGDLDLGLQLPPPSPASVSDSKLCSALLPGGASSFCGVAVKRLAGDQEATVYVGLVCPRCHSLLCHSLMQAQALYDPSVPPAACGGW